MNKADVFNTGPIYLNTQCNAESAVKTGYLWKVTYEAHILI